jgi:hypothetical protein
MRSSAVGVIWWIAVVMAVACGTDNAPPAEVDAGVVADAGTNDAGVDCSGRSADAPETRGEVSGVLDADRQRIVLFGGNTSAPEMCMPRYTQTAELWAFELDCSTWRRIDAPGGPGPRARHVAVHDTARDRMLVFGGRSEVGTDFADVWAFDLATNAWSELVTTGTGPAPTYSAAGVYDVARDRLVVFGGNTGSFVGTDGTFALDLATSTWTPIATPEAPPARLLHAATVLGNEMVVFGGASDFDGPFLNDVWAFDLTTDQWRSIRGGGPDAPPVRFGAELFADGAGSRVWMFGGHDLTNLGNKNDLWALDTTTTAWTEVRAGDVLNGIPSGPCMFPPDFTIPDEDSPERRYAFARVQSATTGYVFGGKTDCGNVNDVWAVDVATGVWSQLRVATNGESCNRSGAVECTTLCF